MPAALKSPGRRPAAAGHEHRGPAAGRNSDVRNPNFPTIATAGRPPPTGATVETEIGRVLGWRATAARLFAAGISIGPASNLLAFSEEMP